MNKVIKSLGLFSIISLSCMILYFGAIFYCLLSCLGSMQKEQKETHGSDA